MDYQWQERRDGGGRAPWRAVALASAVHPVLALQRSAGNSAVSHMVIAFGFAPFVVQRVALINPKSNDAKAAGDTDAMSAEQCLVELRQNKNTQDRSALERRLRQLVDDGEITDDNVEDEVWKVLGEKSSFKGAATTSS